jgi:signal transduction histidine kinase/CheY-like chemotaxis protein/HAMP domain-containing protein
MSIRARLLVVLGALSAVIVVLAFSGWTRLAFNEATLTTVYEDRVLPLRQLKTVSDGYSDAIAGSVAELRDGLISWDEAESRIANARVEIDLQWTAYLATYMTSEEKALAAEAARLKAAADMAVGRLVSLLVDRDSAALSVFARSDLRRAIQPLTWQIDRLADLQIDVASIEIASARRTAAESRTLFFILVMVGFVVIAAGGWIAVRRISQPLGRLSRELRHLAEGDAARPGTAQPSDEIEEMSRALDSFRQARLDAERLEAARRTQEEWLRRMLDELPIGVSLFDDNQRVIYRNAEMQRLVPVRDPGKVIGMTLDELTREAILAAGITDPAKVEEISAAAVARYRGAKEGRFESDIRRDRFYGARFRWLDRRLVVAMADISALKAAQVATAQSELRLKTAVQALPVSFCLMSEDMRLMLFNDEFLREFQWFRDEIRLGMSVEEFLDALIRRCDFVPMGMTQANLDRAKQDPAFRAEMVSQLTRYNFDKGDVTRDQIYGGRNYRMGRTRIANGELARVALDITDLKKKEAEVEALGQTALARRTSLLRDVLDAVPDAIAVLDGEVRVAFANRALADASGLGFDEIRGLGLHVLLQHLGIPADGIDALLDGGDESRELEVLRERDNRPLMISATPVATGEILFAVADLTEQRRREIERLEQQKRLAHADKNQALVTLAGTIAHDFNNLLGVMDGFATMAHEDATALATVEDSTISRGIVTALDRVLAGSERARQIVQSLNTLGKERELPTDEIDLREAVTEAGQLLRVLVPASVRLVYETPDVPCRTVSNSVQIEQIVTNLVINGVHAMEGRAGTVTVRLELIDLDGGRAEGLRDTEAAEKRTGYYIEPASDGSASLFSGVLEPSRYVKLTVADQGSGMSEETLRKILNPFFTTKAPGRGTGLGLSSVLEIATAHRGGLHIRTRLGAGTEVMILFPEAKAAETKATAWIQPGSTTGDLVGGVFDDEIRTESRILVIDDEEMLIELATSVLGKLGHEIESYKDPRSALDRFAGDPNGFDLVITDHTMPDMTGSELVERIARIRPDIPVIMVTGSSSVQQGSEKLPKSVRQLISKPYKPQHLEKAVRLALAP